MRYGQHVLLLTSSEVFRRGKITRSQLSDNMLTSFIASYVSMHCSESCTRFGESCLLA